MREGIGVVRDKWLGDVRIVFSRGCGWWGVEFLSIFFF